ncbi:ABC transporter substrate-binding protein [Bifidobacterium sp. UTCIF-36]|uniref:ABC transporter substrate-binding protein n=1 Tax=Bifidobacterium sp. UTCIF-36 TaxID=1465258 RepID=UPI001EC00349|nr:ABC transporter substrate-binding protein [Bifidobacterium sp. UTCIF-36]TPF84825.1 ABC transporter substrate-binding protein [Bifidobacterium sp. UTCIF-36]
MKKITKIATATVAVLSMVIFSGCGNENNTASDSEKGRVYLISQKVENHEQFVELGQKFSDATGIPFDVISPSADSYEQTLKSELAKTAAPTLIGLDNNDFPNWTDYLDDLSDTSMYKDLKDQEYVLKDGDKVGAIPFVLDRYGIIYNKAILQQYFDSDWSSVKSIDDIRGFDALKNVADEIQAHKDDLGIRGAFTSAGFESSSIRRYGDQLAHIPVYYEYRDHDITELPATVSDKYMPNLKKIFDLYITDETIEPTQLSSATFDDAVSEFSLGEAVFIQTGSWAYPQLKNQEVPDEDMGVLPIYMGVDGEENAGLTISSNYFAINSKVSDVDKQATRKFLDWMLNDEEARQFVTDDMGFETPFKSYEGAGYKTKNPVLRANDAYAARGCYDMIIRPLPTQQWSLSLGNAMLEYAQGTGDWDTVASAFVDGWASEYKTTH